MVSVGILHRTLVADNHIEVVVDIHHTDPAEDSLHMIVVVGIAGHRNVVADHTRTRSRWPCLRASRTVPSSAPFAADLAVTDHSSELKLVVVYWHNRSWHLYYHRHCEHVHPPPLEAYEPKQHRHLHYWMILLVRGIRSRMGSSSCRQAVQLHLHCNLAEVLQVRLRNHYELELSVSPIVTFSCRY